MAEWFRRTSKNIKTFYKRDTQEGSWLKCPECNEMIYRKVLEEKFYVCNNCAKNRKSSGGLIWPTYATVGLAAITQHQIIQYTFRYV